MIAPIAGPARAEGIATAAGAVAAGAALLAWPAFANGYPLMFSDTGAFLHQTLGPLMIWDKPWVYGPFLHLFHWRLTLWLPLAAQALAMLPSDRAILIMRVIPQEKVDGAVTLTSSIPW